MKLLVMVLLTLCLQGHCASFAKLDSKENQTDANQQRSARVHRTANYDSLKNDDSLVENMIKDIVSKQSALLNQQFTESLINFPNLKKLVQQEAQLFLELNVILNELVRDGTASLKNIELAISEMIDTGASSTSIKSVPTNDNDLKSLLNSLKNLDSYLQDGLDNDNQLYSMKNVAQSLDNVLIKIQNHISFVRNVFNKLCRKHHSTLSTQANTSNPEKFALMNQAKEVPAL